MSPKESSLAYDELQEEVPLRLVERCMEEATLETFVAGKGSNKESSPTAFIVVKGRLTVSF